MLGQSYDLQKSSTREGGFVGVKVFYRELVVRYPIHSFKTCGGPEAITPTTTFKKCGVKTSSGGQERYILITHLELLYHNSNDNSNQ